VVCLLLYVNFQIRPTTKFTYNELSGKKELPGRRLLSAPLVVDVVKWLHAITRLSAIIIMALSKFYEKFSKKFLNPKQFKMASKLGPPNGLLGVMLSSQ
jgi:hypothetical protein